jgi:hypothetical protein
MSEKWLAYLHLISQLSANTSERGGLSDSGHCMTRSILSEHAPIAPKHLVKNHGASFH